MRYVPTTLKKQTNTEPLYGCLHKRRIDISYAIEIISEMYGDVLPLLDSNSLIYGGIIRDIVAGMFPLVGDLDIVTSNMSYTTVVSNLSSCNKITWKPKTQNNIYRGKSYVGSLSNFETHDGKSIQIIRPMRGVVDVLESTDLVCCGVVMTHDGEVFEVVNGAENACRNRILTINSSGSIDANINERIKKLVYRGWKSKISTSEIKKMCNKKRHNNKRLPPGNKSSMPNNTRISKGDDLIPPMTKHPKSRWHK